MPSFVDWVPYTLPGLALTTLGLFKVYGLCRGIKSGRGRPVMQRLCGQCQRPVNRAAMTALPFVLLAIGVGELALCARVFLTAE